jgi:hypothetical protein
MQKWREKNCSLVIQNQRTTVTYRCDDDNDIQLLLY